MATSTSKTLCSVCDKFCMIYTCPACSKHFCFDHLSEHRTKFTQQVYQLQNSHDNIRHEIDRWNSHPTEHPLIKQIDQWGKDSIVRIRQLAEQYRATFCSYSNKVVSEMHMKLNEIAKHMKQIHQGEEIIEIDLKDLEENFQKLQEEWNQLRNVSVKVRSTTFINQISLLLPIGKDTRWKQSAITIAGRNGQGNQVDQLNRPAGICIDDQNQLIYIADSENHRIVEWKLNLNGGRIVAGGNGQGNRLDQLNHPKDVIIDRKSNALIIADHGNRRVMKWSRQSNSSAQIIIDDIGCFGLALHEDGTLYVSDLEKHGVRRWKKGEIQRIIAAGGNGEGNRFDQLNCPTRLFIDHDHTLYISDSENDRVIKWVKDAKEGIVVAGGNGRGDQLTQLSAPRGVLVDQSGQIYVADLLNHRVMRWREGEKEGRIVVGGNGEGQRPNQFNRPTGLTFDSEGNLYVTDHENHRIQKFERDFH